MDAETTPRSGRKQRTNDRRRWLALVVLCLGDLMIVLDSTIVNVALPSIREDLGFSGTLIAWVVNAYLLTFGGFLLLGGRLGDLFGYRRLFLVGIMLFTLASLGCGLASSQELLVGARAPVDGNFAVDVLPSMLVQGFGAGIAFNPLLLAAMSDVAPQESGLASGVVNTAFMMGGAPGLAILTSLAASHTDTLLGSGDGALAALNGGYHVAFLVGALFAVAAAVLGTVLLRASAATAPTNAESAAAPGADHDPKEVPMQAPD